MDYVSAKSMDSKFSLQKWNDLHIPALIKHANNQKIAANLRDSFPNPYTENDAKQWIEMNRHKDPPTSFAIEVNEAVIGGIGVHSKADVYRKNVELGYWIAEPYWNLGIATAVVRQMVNYTFKTIDVSRIYACVFESNKASMRVLEKNGFKLEGILEKSVYKNGKLLDEYIFALLRV